MDFIAVVAVAVAVVAVVVAIVFGHLYYKEMAKTSSVLEQNNQLMQSEAQARAVSARLQAELDLERRALNDTALLLSITSEQFELEKKYMEHLKNWIKRKQETCSQIQLELGQTRAKSARLQAKSARLQLELNETQSIADTVPRSITSQGNLKTRIPPSGNTKLRFAE